MTQGRCDVGLVASQTDIQLVKEQSEGAPHRFGLGHSLIAVGQLDQAYQTMPGPVRGVDGESHQAAGQVAQVSVPEVREHCDHLSG